MRSYLENPMDRGAWWATVRGVAESDTTETNTPPPKYTPHVLSVGFHTRCLLCLKPSCLPPLPAVNSPSSMPCHQASLSPGNRSEPPSRVLPRHLGVSGPACFITLDIFTSLFLVSWSRTDVSIEITAELCAIRTVAVTQGWRQSPWNMTGVTERLPFHLR